LPWNDSTQWHGYGHWLPELTLLNFHKPAHPFGPGGPDIGPHGLILTLNGIELLGLAVIYSGLFFVFKDRPKK
jgi:hypothetical protein